MNNSAEHTPNPIQLSKTLIALYADQEEVIIKGEIVIGDKTVVFNTSENNT